MRRTRRVAAVGLLLLVATACSEAAPETAAPPSEPVVASPPAEPSPAPCASPGRPPAFAWPKPVPSDFPRLPGARLGATKRAGDGVTVVEFRTPTSLRDGVLYVVSALPAAGFVLGRGDAEFNQADAPFTRGDVSGLLRGNAAGPCLTEWLLAVAARRRVVTGNPLLPVPPGVTPSPLPFGNG